MSRLIIMLYTLMAFCIANASNSSSAQFNVSGTVAKVVTALLSETDNLLIYNVHEVSNNPNGYVVTLKTDVNSVNYDGMQLTVSNGQVTITQVLSQTKTIDVIKQLTFTSIPKYVIINVLAD